MTRMAGKSASKNDQNDQMYMGGSQKVLLQMRPKDSKGEEAIKTPVVEEKSEKKVLLSSTTGVIEQPEF